MSWLNTDGKTLQSDPNKSHNSLQTVVRFSLFVSFSIHQWDFSPLTPAAYDVIVVFCSFLKYSSSLLIAFFILSPHSILHTTPKSSHLLTISCLFTIDLWTTLRCWHPSRVMKNSSFDFQLNMDSDQVKAYLTKGNLLNRKIRPENDFTLPLFFIQKAEDFFFSKLKRSQSDSSISNIPA